MSWAQGVTVLPGAQTGPILKDDSDRSRAGVYSGTTNGETSRQESAVSAVFSTISYPVAVTLTRQLGLWRLLLPQPQLSHDSTRQASV